MSKLLVLAFLLLPAFVLSKKNFVIVLDTTKSMVDELSIIKSYITTATDAVRDSALEYILLPFGDPDVGPPIVATTPGRLYELISLIEVGHGNTCPEKSLSAIEMALERSQPNSYIFLFTDAKPLSEDLYKISAIRDLCETRRSQVVIFLSGKCSGSEPIDVAYYEVAKTCSGTVFFYQLQNLRKAFTYMKQLMKVDWNEVKSQYEFSKEKQLSFEVDTYTTHMMISVAADNPDIQIINYTGKTQRVISTSYSCVIIIVEPIQGEITAKVRGRDYGLVTLHTRRQLNFQYGFSPKIPRTLEETSKKPLPGSRSNILIIIDENIELTSVDLEMIKTGEVISLAYELIDENRGYYITNNTFESGKSFRISITVKDKSTYQSIYGRTNTIEPQPEGMVTEWMKPLTEIINPDSNSVDFGTNATFACKVTTFPSANIWWEDDNGETLPSESVLLEIPATYISYVSIDNATRSGVITCKAKNDMNEAEAPLSIVVNRTYSFNVLRYPSDITVTYGEEENLYCEVDAYPEATIQWYHNDTEVTTNQNVAIESEDHALVIYKMDIDNAGEYTCKITNEIESRDYTATVYITGLEFPQVQLKDMDIILKPGEFTQQKCTLSKGVPEPTISWKYKVAEGFEYTDIPEGAYVENDMLKISSTEISHGGTYVCEATNILGTDSQGINVKVQYPPKIKNNDEILELTEGDSVNLPCEVDAVPKPEVHWDMYQDDVIISFDNSHYTDESHTHRFIAKANDSGMYHCIAENSMGRTMRTVNINVLVAPYIEPPITSNLTQRIGSTVYLDCYIIQGNPVPSTRWEFLSTNTNITVLARGHSTGSLNYVLKNISKRNEGTYRCIAENRVAVDSVPISLRVI